MHRRIFIAVDISDEARLKVSKYAAKLRQEFSNIRTSWDKPEKLHLTLKFLGKIENRKLEKLKEIVSGISQKAPPFKLEIRNAGVFPSPKRSRVLWLDVVDETKALTELNRLLENECEKIGFAKETRKYTPHLTIARIKEPEKAGSLAQRHLQIKFEPVKFEVSELVIYESKLQPAGSVYSVVSKHNLR